MEESEEESDLSTIEDLIHQEEPQTSESIDSKDENLYWESDDVNPNLVIYDLENNRTFVPSSEEEIITPQPSPVEKVITRNVSSRRRNFR